MTIYVAWSGLVVVLALLAFAAHHFSRHAYRIISLGAFSAGLIGVLIYGAVSGNAANLATAITAGGRQLMAALLDASPQQITPVADWATVLAACTLVLVLLDMRSARHEPPRVDVPGAPKREKGEPGLDERRRLTEELKFRLPAVFVRRPATMPGGSTTERLASVVSAAPVKDAKFVAALMQAVHYLEAQPRTYQAFIFAECCDHPGRSRDDYWHITLDLQDARTGSSVVVRTLPACQADEAAEMVAGFTAHQVLADDPATPGWAAGSSDGADLAAYLRSQQVRAVSPCTYGELLASRQKRKCMLLKAVRAGAPGLIGYELAAMHDMDGEHLQALALHLRNRVQYPRFWAGRYRLAMSLSMLAGPLFGHEWPGPHEGALKEEIRSGLELAGIRRFLEHDQVCMKLLDLRDADFKKALLGLAEHEFGVYRRWTGPAAALIGAFWYRDTRASLLQSLREDCRDGRWRHPRRKRLISSRAIDLVKQRRSLIADDDAGGCDQLADAQKSARKALRLCQRPPADASRAPWQAVYNTA
jgi:hypothetical protein